MLFRSARALALGAPVTLRFRIGPWMQRGERVDGIVVRALREAPGHGEHPLPFLTAVHFRTPVDEIAAPIA